MAAKELTVEKESKGWGGFHMIKPIGKGAYGKVFLVVNKDKKEFVLKKIELLNMTKEERDSAMTEVKLLSTLSHPFVIRFYDAFADSSALAIIMEYAKRGTLYERIARMKKTRRILTEAEVVQWLTQLALGLKYIHSKRIIHRDLKTQNLFLTEDWRLRIGDFGISRQISNNNELAQTIIGTPLYVAPEIPLGKGYSFSSDIWSMGCIVYELCVQRVPFYGDNFASILQMVVLTKVPEIPVPPYSQELSAITKACLVKVSENRITATDIVRSKIVQMDIARLLLLNSKPEDIQNNKVDRRGSKSSAEAGKATRRKSSTYSKKSKSSVDSKSEKKNTKGSPSTDGSMRQHRKKSSHSSNRK